MTKQIEDMSCQSNFEERLSDFGSLLVSNYYCSYIHFIPGWFGAEIKFTVHVALPQRTSN